MPSLSEHMTPFCGALLGRLPLVVAAGSVRGSGGPPVTQSWPTRLNVARACQAGASPGAWTVMTEVGARRGSWSVPRSSM